MPNPAVSKSLTRSVTDDEISKIIVARALGVQSQHEGAAAEAHGQAAMSGALSNFNAVMAYARGIIPAVASQIMTVRDRSATASVRLAAFLSLLVKAALLAIFGYVVSLEFTQLRLSIDRARADACIARSQNLVNTMPNVNVREIDPAWEKANKQFMEDCER
jgi:hypothetical protein